VNQISYPVASGRIVNSIPENIPDEYLGATSDEPDVVAPDVIGETPTPRSSGEGEKPVILGSSQNPNDDSDSSSFPIKLIVGAVAGLIALALLTWIAIRGRGKTKHKKAA
jgi:hypothetical protein